MSVGIKRNRNVRSEMSCSDFIKKVVASQEEGLRRVQLQSISAPVHTHGGCTSALLIHAPPACLTAIEMSSTSTDGRARPGCQRTSGTGPGLDSHRAARCGEL